MVQDDPHAPSLGAQPSLEGDAGFNRLPVRRYRSSNRKKIRKCRSGDVVSLAASLVNDMESDDAPSVRSVQRTRSSEKTLRFKNRRARMAQALCDIETTLSEDEEYP